MHAFLSPRDLALAIGVSESSLKRWVDSGVLQAVKTEGGHRRIPIAEAVRFVRERRAVIVRPDLLGLDAASEEALLRDAEPLTQKRLEAALVAGDAATVRGLILGAYLRGAGVAALFDGPLQGALAAIGELWHADERGILTEHRATDLCIQALQVLRGTMVDPPPQSPLAFTAALAGDPYLIPPLLASIVASEAGFRTRNLGPDLPPRVLARAIVEESPRLVCVSLSALRRTETTASVLAPVIAALRGTGTDLVVGGRLADARDLPAHANVGHAHSMVELAAFARGLLAAQREQAPEALTSARSRRVRAVRRPRT